MIMHLIGFHRVLIACAAAFCIGYGVWELAGYRADGGPGSLVLGLASLLAGAALLLYLRRLRRFLRLPD
jgi:hypothetical protein